MSYLPAVSPNDNIDDLISAIVNNIYNSHDGVFVTSGWFSGHSNDYIGLAFRVTYNGSVPQIRIGGLVIDNNDSGQSAYYFTSVGISYSYYKINITT